MAGSGPVVIGPEALSQAWVLYENEGWSLPRLSKRFGISISTLRNRLLAMGVVLRTRAEGIKIANGLGSGLRGKTREFSEEWKARISSGRLAWAELNAVGTSLKPSGYVEVTRGPDKGRSVHRVVAEAVIGRALLPDEDVHHVDRNRSNNDPSNLIVLSRSEHCALHRREDGPIPQQKAA